MPLKAFRNSIHVRLPAVITGRKHLVPKTCRYLLLLSLLIAITGVAGVIAPSAIAKQHATKSGDSSTDQRYNEAKFYYNQLLTNNKLSAESQNWAKGAQNFRRIYLADPKASQAAACLFMLGQIYNHIFQRFQETADLDESISYYQDTARLFPQHRLADDSYYAMGLIYLSEKKDPVQAAVQFSKIVEEYPNGDMHPLAADMLKQLSKDHDIALPPAMVGSSQLSKLNYVLPVKYWSSDDYTRVVIVASGPVNYREELLQQTDDKPRRLYIDFMDSYIEPQYREPVPIKDGLLQQIRTGQFSKDTVRVVLDIESIESYKTYSLPDPFRVVIDVRGKSSLKEQKSPSKPTPALADIGEKVGDTLPSLQDQKKIPAKGKGDIIKIARRQPDPPAVSSITLAQQLGLGVRRVVLDPGHGGKDPGAMANNLKEKDIVLKLAKELKPLLEQDLGCEVILTRDSDTFISLEERTAIANTRNADLFVSLHINAHPSSKVRGMETYFLNLSTNAEAMRVAAMENSTSTHQMSDLQDILSDILQNSKIDESSRLAQQVHSTMVSGLSGNKSYGNIQNLGVKQAPFYVLIGAQMPAILIEVAFISNDADASNLKSANFLASVAKEISSGIQTYVSRTTASL